MKTLVEIALALAMVACQQAGSRGWEAHAEPNAPERRAVEDYDVEFLPVLPDAPGAEVVGFLERRRNARMAVDDERWREGIRRKAAALGGNTIVYSGEGATRLPVAYVPPATENRHGGDEESEDDEEDGTESGSLALPCAAP